LHPTRGGEFQDERPAVVPVPLAKGARLMARCPHGFERSAVPCEECDAVQRREPERTRCKRKARRGGAGGGMLAQFSPWNTKSPGTRPRHPSFLDETGRVYEGAVVLERAPNEKGNACWVLLLPCGHKRTLQAIHLRKKTPGTRWRCAECQARARRT
jgi:hypothetical protein